MTRPYGISGFVRDTGSAKRAAKPSRKVIAPGRRASARSGEAEAWLEENREALDAYNRQIEKRGLPLAQYRRF